MKITIIGTGYIGLTEGVCFADIGHDVVCVDLSQAMIDQLNAGIPTLYENGLDAMLKRTLKKQKIFFTTNLQEALKDTDCAMICVNTPEGKNGHADLTAVYKVAESVAKLYKGKKKLGLVVRSTVPVGTNKKVREVALQANPEFNFYSISNPEFSKQGSAIADFLKPDRIIVGVNDKKAEKLMKEIYKPITDEGYPLFVSNIETAELIKYAANAFLATKVAFINEMADLCEKSGGDVGQLADAMGLDKRISPKFLQAGPGMGGSCFPKDTIALAKIGDQYGVNFSLVKSVVESNKARKKNMGHRLMSMLKGKAKGQTIALLGATFKAGTDDTRYSPALSIIEVLAKHKINVKVYDPRGLEKLKTMLSERALKYLKCYDNPYQAVENANVLGIVTEWKEFKELDYSIVYNVLRDKVIFDMRNLLNREAMEKLGFRCVGLGR